MKKLFAYLRSIFYPASRDIKKIRKDLSSLEKEMNEISGWSNQVKAIVRLFQVISPIQDKGGFAELITNLKRKNYGQMDGVISALEILQIHFRKAGREEFGMNRTKKGEEVTAGKVYLGDVFGIWTFSAEHFLSKQKDLEHQFREDISKDPKNPVSMWWIINNYQAEAFVKSHTKGILEQIEILKKVA